MHVFVGRLSERRVHSYGASSPGWFHVVNDSDGAEGIAPVHAAGDAETLELGGGDRLWPGDATDIYGTQVFVAPPRVGALPKISIELRERQSFVHHDPLGALVASAVAKVEDFPLTPKTWHNISGGVIGTYAVVVRARGGSAHIGTHMGLRYGDGSWRPPTDLAETAGKSWRLSDGVAFPIPGNPHLWAWTDEGGAEKKVVLEVMKFERGWSFGGYGT